MLPTDPALGFPVGEPEPESASWQATLHNLSPMLMGLALIAACIAACIAFARRYAKQKSFKLMTLSVIVPIVYLTLGFAAFPLEDLRWLLAGGALIWVWPSVIMIHERHRAAER